MIQQGGVLWIVTNSNCGSRKRGRDSIKLKTEYGELLHPQVIHQSMVLDELINMYNYVKRIKPME